MKKVLLALFLVCCLPGVAHAALSASTVWELRGNGNDLNGGGFVVAATANLSKTDLVVDATVNTKVSSTTYGFTSADVGRWLKVTAGTNFTVAWFNIKSVTSGVATLDRSPAPVASTAGSFTVYFGLDYSQQNAKNANGGTNGSSVLGVANGTTTYTCSDCQFTKDIIGNVIYLSGGTGSIAAQRRSVTGETNATTITIDATIAASTGMTVNIGGALATLDEALGSRGVVASNRLWWKNDTSISSSAQLSNSNFFELYGYTTTRGDNGRPTLLSTAAGFALTITGNATKIANITINCQSTASCSGISFGTLSGAVTNCKVSNYDNIGIQSSNGTTTIAGNEVTGGTTNATAGIKPTVAGSIIVNNYVHDGNGVGILATSSGPIIRNIVSNQAGSTADGIQVTSAQGSTAILNNTVYNSGRHGISLTPTSVTGALIQNNILVSNGQTSSGGYGISTSLATLPAAATFDGNAFYNNFSGTRNSIDAHSVVYDDVPYTNINDISLSGNPFTSAGTGDFSLNSTAGAGATLQNGGLPRSYAGSITNSYIDLGASQHNGITSSTVYSNCSY